MESPAVKMPENLVPLKNKNKVIPNSKISELYQKMYLARRFEEKAAQGYGMGLIGGFCHLYIGQEAVVAGVYSAIDTKKDQVITSYRDHAQMIFAGTDPKLIMAELFGKATGISKGKGGSMHMFDTANGFYGGHGIVGAQVSIGTGLAFANKYKENGGLSVVFFGDGAAQQGQVYESFNMAKLWNLPVIYIVENNGYAMGTSTARGSSMQELYKRGEGYGILSKQVNGMDVFEVTNAMQEACKYIRAGNGPVFLEIKTYRYRGHSMSDPATYRAKEEVEFVRGNLDPIILFQKYITDNKILSQKEIEKIEASVEETVAEAFEFAKASPEPDASEMYTDVYI